MARDTELDRLKAEQDAAYQRKQYAYEVMQAAWQCRSSARDAMNQAFKARLEKVRDTHKRHQDDNRSIAEKAGVPYQYLGDLRVSRDKNGNTNIYFGGIGKSDGPRHGHYVVDHSGKVTYRRDPFDPHGSQNFTDSAEQASDITTTWWKLGMSQDRDTGTVQTDNYFGIVGDKDQKGKGHIAVDEHGNIAYVRDVGGKVLYDRKHGVGHLPDDLDWSNEQE